MKLIIFLFAFIISKNVLSQYPTWMPDEFKNKVFCGNKKRAASGSVKDMPTMGLPNPGTVYCDIEYEIYIAESGLQVKFNPGVKWNENKWGETIKVKYETIEIEKSQFGVYYRIDLTSKNETDDSPIYPKYKLKKFTFYISTYDGWQPTTREEIRSFREPSKSHFYCHVDVPYYDSGAYLDSKESNICNMIKTNAELLEDKKQNELIEKNNQIINSFLSKNQIDSAIDFYSKSGANKTHLEFIKKYLSDKNTPSKFLSEAELFELLLEKKNLLYKIKNANLKLNILDNGLAQLKKEDKVIETFNVDDKYIIYNNYKNIRYPIKVTYDIKLEMDTNKRYTNTIVLSDEYKCLSNKNYLDKRIKFYWMRDKKNEIVVGYYDWGSTKNSEDTIKCIQKLSKKYHDIQTINFIKFSNNITNDHSQYFYSYKVKLNDKPFPDYIFTDGVKNYIFPKYLFYPDWWDGVKRNEILQQIINDECK